MIIQSSSSKNKSFQSIDLLCDLACKVMFFEPTEALFLNGYCRDLATEFSYNNKIGYTHIIEGISQLLLNNYASAHLEFEKAGEFFQKKPEQFSDAICWLKLYKAYLSYFRDSAEVAFSQLETSIEFSKTNNFKDQQIWGWLYLGEVASMSEDSTKALNTYQQGLDLIKSDHSQPLVSYKLHYGIYSFYKKQQEYHNALTHYELYHNLLLEYYKIIQKTTPETLFIKALEGLESSKSDVNLIVKDIKFYAEIYKHVQKQKDHFQELHALIAHLEHETHEDPLTKIHNRRHFDEQFDIEFVRSKRHAQVFSLCIADVDHFKTINDKYSHLIGDQVLKEIAGIFEQKCRRTDLVARYGGEEFVILLPMTLQEKAILVCERIRLAIQNHDWRDINPGLKVTISMGVVESTPYQSSYDLLKAADNELYKAKKSGRNLVSPTLMHS